jgi:molybdate transport system substrate-binding protein
VFAAASLTDAFSEIGKNYIAAHPGTKFAFNFGGSPTLRTQLDQGARADVFASADIANMTGAEQDGTIASKPALFAQNKLEIIVPKANPGHIQTPADLAKPGIKLVLAAANVPVGNYARQVLQNLAKDPAYGEGFDTKALANVVSNEANVKDVVAKVQLAEADAGIVYVTDPTITVRPQVAEIAIPDASNVIAQYPIAVVKNAPNATGGQAFIDYVLSSDGQAVMQKYGFAAPPVALAQPQRALAALTMP